MASIDRLLKYNAMSIRFPYDRLPAVKQFFTISALSKGVRAEQSFMLTLSFFSAFLSKSYVSPGRYESSMLLWLIGLDYSG
jgi:hypothetical protein